MPDSEFFVPGALGRCLCGEDMAESGLAEVRGIDYAGRGVCDVLTNVDGGTLAPLPEANSAAPKAYGVSFIEPSRLSE